MNISQEIWIDLRPYLVKLIPNFLIFVVFWLLLDGVKLLTTLLPISGYEGKAVAAVHSTGLVVAMAVLAWYSVADIVGVRRRGAP